MHSEWQTFFVALMGAGTSVLIIMAAQFVSDRIREYGEARELSKEEDAPVPFFTEEEDGGK